MTTRVLRAVPVALCAALLPGWLAEPASAAGPPRTGTGTGVITSVVITSTRAAGPNTIQERRLEGALEGALQGVFVQDARGVIHPDGLVTFQATLEFAGTVEGCGDEEGTLTAAVSGHGQAGQPVTYATVRVINQASNTLRVNGQGWMHQVGADVTYEVKYVCR